MELVGTGRSCHHVDMATRDLARLAARVRAHRMELFKSREAAADKAGVSKDTWKRVEEGAPVWDTKLGQISRALGWTSNSGIVVAEGGEPILAEAPGSAPVQTLSPMPAEDVRRAVFELASKTLPASPIGGLDDFSDGLVEVLRRAGMVKDEG